MASPEDEKAARLDDGDSSESEGEYETTGRVSEDVRRHDMETLTAEEEAERLLQQDTRTQSSTFGQNMAARREARRQRKRDAQREGRGLQSERRELMYDTEEGRRSSSESSSEADLGRLKEVQAEQKHKSRRASRFARIGLIHVVIIAAFIALVWGAYRATVSLRSHRHPVIAQKLSNGTHTFLPTTILLSLDGFRSDFLTRNLTPTLNGFIRDGVSPKYMTPSFPSLTFPNHYTIVTGLYPESHGVVGNTFWDPATSKEFYYTDPDRSMQPEWWSAEPIWLTAELSDVKSAIHMWPGSEAHIGGVEPAFVDVYNGHEQLSNKVDRITGWLDLPEESRPQLIAAYVPNVDQDGHQSGPNSTHIRITIEEVDKMLSQMFRGIDERNLTDVVNIIVVSDHGMATTSINRLIQYEDLLDPKTIEHTDGWPLYGLRPYNKTPEYLDTLYNDLLTKSRLPQYQDTFDVYLRDKNMPARYHFSSNHRIAPIWIVPRTGWAIVTKDEFDIIPAKQRGDEYKPRGLHGYDCDHPLMRAIFVARGPAFPHPKGSRVQEFSNVEVYNIVCDSLGLEPRPNNGTLRLPFTTQGLHDFDSDNQVDVEIPHDPQDDWDEAADPDNLNFGVLPPIMPTMPLPPIEPATPESPVSPTQPIQPARPVISEEPTPEDGDDQFREGFLEWVKLKLLALKLWSMEQLGWEIEKEAAANATTTAGAETG